MKKVFFLQFFFLFPLLLYAQGVKKQEERVVNFGAKAGFTSAMMLVDKLGVGGERIGEVQNSYKIGYFGSLFMRINFDRHFLQPEVSYNVNRSSISFTKPVAEEESSVSAFPQSSSVNSSIYSIAIPIIYGYNIIKEGPYSLAVFGGPKLQYVWRHKSNTEFANFDQTEMEEELYPLNASFTMGLAVTISRIFFDFRYDIGLHNLSKSISYPGMEYDETPFVRLKRRENALSFSLGVFF